MCEQRGLRPRKKLRNSSKSSRRLTCRTSVSQVRRIASRHEWLPCASVFTWETCGILPRPSQAPTCLCMTTGTSTTLSQNPEPMNNLVQELNCPRVPVSVHNEENNAPCRWTESEATQLSQRTAGTCRCFITACSAPQTLLNPVLGER